MALRCETPTAHASATRGIAKVWSGSWSCASEWLKRHLHQLRVDRRDRPRVEACLTLEPFTHSRRAVGAPERESAHARLTTVAEKFGRAQVRAQGAGPGLRCKSGRSAGRDRRKRSRVERQ